MTHTYNISGMTCSSCSAKVKSALLKLPDVLSADVSINPGKAVIEMQNHIPLASLSIAVGSAGNYTIAESGNHTSDMASLKTETKSWFATYKPLLLIAFFIVLVSTLVSFHEGQLNWMQWMNSAMAGFFLIFSFFKLLDVKAFAETYSMYDVVAKRIKAYGFIYPFIELALGIAFLTGFNPFFTNIATLIVMSVSIMGVLQSVLNKRKIQCACLGAVFNLPMSTVTIIEDTLMIVMSAAMLILM